MLIVSHVSKSYGIQTVLEDVSFIINPGERAGLVGPNGAGKTTLLRVIAGIEPSDAGFARVSEHATLGYLPQGQTLDTTLSLDALVRQGVRAWDQAKRAMDEFALKLAENSSNPNLLAEYTDAFTRFDSLGGYDVETRVQEVLRGLGLDRIPVDLPVDKLSGGQRTRAGLARLLISEPDVLLLDEPTNHLDVDALEWLEHFIRQYKGAAFIVSHDRLFLDHTVSQIIELDDRTHQITVYHGNYSEYEATKGRELERQWSAYQDQQTELARLTEASRHLRGVAKFRKGGKADTNDKFAKGFFANRSKATVARAKNIEKRIEHIQTIEKIDKPRAGYAMKLDFGEMPRSGQLVMSLEHVGMSFDGHPLFHNVSQILGHGERIALIGSNGTCKSTLLKIIVGEIQPTEGSVRLGANVRIGYMPQEQESLPPMQTSLGLIRSLMPVDETEARHFLHYFMFEGDEVFTPIGKLSYGERARLILAKLVSERANFLVLDEPINHLGIPSRERFEAALDAFPGTILVAGHDRAFIDRFASGIWSIESGILHVYPDRSAMRH